MAVTSVCNFWLPRGSTARIGRVFSMSSGRAQCSREVVSLRLPRLRYGRMRRTGRSGARRHNHQVTAVDSKHYSTAIERGVTWTASAWWRQQRESRPFPRAFLSALKLETIGVDEVVEGVTDDAGGAVRVEDGDKGVAQGGGGGARVEIETLRRQLADRDKETARLREQLAVRSEAAARLARLLADREGEVSRLRSALERPDGVSDRSAQLAERELAREELRVFAALTGSQQQEEEAAAVAQRASDAMERTSARFDEEPHRRRMAAVVSALASEMGMELALVGDLGSGKFADVVLVRDGGEGGREVAVKVAEGEFDMGLLRAESENIAYLSSITGSEEHIVRQLISFVEVEVEVREGERIGVGAVVLEKAASDLEGLVGGVMGSGGAEAMSKVDNLKGVEVALGRWERSLMWLHSQGCLHLDIKPDNAVCFGDERRCTAVKLIDLSGMITRRHIPNLPDQVPNTELLWDTADLQRAGLEYICTDAYCQPREMSRGGRVLDYSIDWWSMGVSKMELLRLAPAFFGEERDTAGLVMQALISGELEASLREEVRGMLGMDRGEAGEEEAEVTRWVDSILCNLHGKPAPLV